MPESDVTFSLTESNYKELLEDNPAILKSPDLSTLIGTKGGDIILKVCDKKNDTSNSFDIVVGQGVSQQIILSILK